jgi:membrane-anchored protein YejM (alkaline phosphatase superfamily)
MPINLLNDKAYSAILKSFYQKDFTHIKKQIAEVLEQENDKEKLFRIILCEHFEEIKKCEDTGLKIVALKNALIALTYLGERRGNI